MVYADTTTHFFGALRVSDTQYLSDTIALRHDGKKSFLRAFSDFFKKLFRTQNPLFSPVFACFANPYARVRFHYL